MDKKPIPINVITYDNDKFLSGKDLYIYLSKCQKANVDWGIQIEYIKEMCLINNE